MLKLIRSAALVLMLVPSIGQAQSIDKGFAAIKADDYATALKEWLPLAEDQQSRELQYIIGQIYYGGGNGVLQNYTEARKWFLRAAEVGHVDAQFYLGGAYAVGAPQDYVLAHMWINIANANGQKDAAAYRNRLELRMTADEIALAQELAIRCRDYAYTREYCNRGDPPPAAPALSEKQPSIPNLARKPQVKPADLLLPSLTPKDSPQASEGDSLKTTDPTTSIQVDPSAQADVDAVASALVEVDPASIQAGTWLVQLGAFETAESAREEWSRLQARFPALVASKALVVQPAQTAQSSGRTFYRLRAHGFENEDETRRFCAALLAENASCIAVTQRRSAKPVTDAQAKADAAEQADADAVAAALTEAAGGAQHVAEGPPMTQAEIEGLNLAINKCLDTGKMSTDALNTTIQIRVEMSEDAKPDYKSIKMTGFSGGSEAAAQIAFQVARKAIVLCGQKGFGLDPAKYGQWAVLNMTFDPNGMRLR